MSLLLREGAYYRNGHGGVRGPVEPHANSHYPWQVGGDTYSVEGKWFIGESSLDDLVEEVVVLPLMPTTELLADLENGYNRKREDMASVTPTEDEGEGPWFAGYWNMVFSHRARNLVKSGK